jgi:hypothetical protein
VALTLTFRPNSTSEELRGAVLQITRCLQEADERITRVYIRPSAPVLSNGNLHG